MILRDAARGLAYLHGFVPPIAHGSIHPTEILVTDDFRGVLCDFGSSRVVTNVQTGFTTSTSTISGRKGFMSKELIDGSTIPPTPMGDVYGLGGTILSVMTGKDPFYQLRTHAQAMIAVAFEDTTPSPTDHSELPESDPLWSLMRKCWDGEPNRRPSTPQIIYKINLILDCGSGLTAPFRQRIINTSANAVPDSEDSVVQPGVAVPSLPPPIPGALAMVEYVGGGGYGEVHRGHWTPPGKEPIPVAIKRLKIGNVGLGQTQDNGVLMRV
ncbi:hypothetical protein FRC05_007856 [Tulasnella sp. 425]|nr:hypothetical protein FRC05_007856 [Tulasnella sp. 425]